MEPGRERKPALSGEHVSAMLGVADKDYPAASIATR